MVPLAKEKEALKQLIRNATQLPKPTTLHLKKELRPLITQCIACNELAGIAFHSVNGKTICTPLTVDGYFDEGLLREVFGDCVHPYEKCDLHMKFHHRSFWKYEDFADLQWILTTENDPMEIIRRSLEIAFRVLKRSPYTLSVVCGPISTGGFGNPAENLAVFNQTVYVLSRHTDVFNQMPFEPVFAKVHQLIAGNKAFCPDGSSSRFFIEHFYRKIFSSDKVWYPYFINGWEKSHGATEEHRIFTEQKAKITYLCKNYHQSL